MAASPAPVEPRPPPRVAEGGAVAEADARLLDQLEQMRLFCAAFSLAFVVLPIGAARMILEE